jgi:hypothetical protein
MKVCCCTYYSPSHKALADISLPNLSEYCARHGYYMWVENIENDKWEYKKHEMFTELFEGFDLIWYRDIDSVITDLGKPITGFIDNENDFFITKDFNELNGGSVIIKNTETGIGRFVNRCILDLKNKFQNEQNAINWLMGTPEFNQWVKVLPHPSINSYDYSLYPECKEYVGREDLGDWKEGNFVLHVPALTMDKRIEVLKNAKVTR